MKVCIHVSFVPDDTTVMCLYTGIIHMNIKYFTYILIFIMHEKIIYPFHIFLFYFLGLYYHPPCGLTEILNQNIPNVEWAGWHGTGPLDLRHMELKMKQIHIGYAEPVGISGKRKNFWLPKCQKTRARSWCTSTGATGTHAAK